MQFFVSIVTKFNHLTLRHIYRFYRICITLRNKRISVHYFFDDRFLEKSKENQLKLNSFR